MFKRTEEINNLFNCIQKKTYMAVNLYSTDNVLVKNLEETLKSDMGEKAIFIDIAKTEGFVGFVQEFITNLLLIDDSLEKGPIDDSAISEDDTRLLRRHTGRLLSKFMANNGWFQLVLTHFDCAAEWDDQAFAWMRELVDGGKIPVCIILSEKSLPQISDKPEDSSPFHNVFRNYALQREVN